MPPTSTTIVASILRRALMGEGRHLKIYPGDASGEEPPVPIPNTEVKLSSAEDTRGATPWENRSSPGYFITSAPSVLPAGLLVSCVTWIASARCSDSRGIVVRRSTGSTAATGATPTNRPSRSTGNSRR